MMTSDQAHCQTSSKRRRGYFARLLPVATLSIAWFHAHGAHADEPRATPSVAKTAARLDVIPGRVSSHYPIVSKGNNVELTRTKTGAWNLKMSIRSPARKGAESWAGYCWDINLVNGNDYQTLKAMFSAVEKPAEVQFKLEQKDNRTQERALRFPAVPEVAIPLSNYPAVRPAIARFCLALGVNAEVKTPTDCEVTLTSVVLE